MDTSVDSRHNASANGEGELSPVEQEVLDEYAKLVGNLDNLSGILAELASNPSAEILDALRGLERKTTTVFTLLKASVYSIVLQQEIFGDEGQDGDDGGPRTHIMEALAALGVAAASVQFLDFALQALALCRQIRDDAQGATVTNKELEDYSRSIEGLSRELKAAQADNASGRRIKAIGQACIAKTAEILILLEKVRKAGSNSRTAAAKTLFRSLKERRTIEKLQNELKEKQALLDSALIHDIQYVLSGPAAS
ncbi:hypothetical protein KC330_g1567 [Hortaea werneckii]|nr:hypothetical protein KC330_g1567 [Hortaea werneckii]